VHAQAGSPGAVVRLVIEKMPGWVGALHAIGVGAGVTGFGGFNGFGGFGRRSLWRGLQRDMVVLTRMLDACL